MKKRFLLLLVIIPILLLFSCSSSDVPDEDEEVGSVSNKPILDVLASDTVYQFYNLDKKLNVIEVTSIDDYDDLEDCLIIVNASSIDIDELSMSFVGAYTNSHLNWAPFVGFKNEASYGKSDSLVLLEIFKDIKANSKEKYDLDDLELRAFKYLVFNVEKPSDANIRITYVEERHHDLYIYFTDV